jgi:hypothetical protein
MANHKGLSFTLVIGKYGGFHIFCKHYFRICLGWIAFNIYPIDIESYTETIIQELKN